jgi:ribosome-binding protein aMBF1 (putative translation factor)
MKQRPARTPNRTGLESNFRPAAEGEPSITASQVKAARRLLDWSVIALAIKSNVGTFVIKSFERSERSPNITTLGQLRAAFEAEGATFDEGVVKLKATKSRVDG